MSLFVSPCPSLFSTFFLFLFRLASSCAIHARVSLSRSRRHIGVSHASSLSFFLSSLLLFVLNYVTAYLRCVSAVSLTFYFFFASVNDPGVSLSSFLLWSLLRPRSRVTLRAAAAMSKSAHRILRSLPRSSVAVPPTEQISNK